jgi:pseudouridine synthase
MTSRILLLVLLVASHRATLGLSADRFVPARKGSRGGGGGSTSSHSDSVSRPTASCRTSVLVYHKPAKVVTTHAADDVHGRRNVFQDLMARSVRSNQPDLPLDFPHGWHAVGRLDADTTGLLLLTNDGGLVHRVTNKVALTDKNQASVGKTYEALVMGYHANDCDMLHQFRTVGVDIGAKHGGFTRPVENVQVLGHPTPKSTLVSLTIHEGRNRQIRRMFHACGSGVMKLQRTAVGSELTLSLVPNEGDWCILSDRQISSALQWTPRVLRNSRIGTPLRNGQCR